MKRWALGCMAAVAASLWLAGCGSTKSDDINAAVIYQSYRYEFNAGTGHTIAQARFLVRTAAGDMIRLVSPAEVRLNGALMTDFSDFLKRGYEMVLNRYERLGTFRYTDRDRMVYTNTADLTQVASIAMPAGLTQIDSTRDFTIRWTGDALGPQETAILEVKWNNGAYNQQVVDVGSTGITLTTHDLGAIGRRTVSMRLQRVRKLPIQQATPMGGEMELVWSSPTVEVQIR